MIVASKAASRVNGVCVLSYASKRLYGRKSSRLETGQSSLRGGWNICHSSCPINEERLSPLGEAYGGNGEQQMKIHEIGGGEGIEVASKRYGTHGGGRGHFCRLDRQEVEADIGLLRIWWCVAHYIIYST